jgi:hypothetical protein
MRHLRMITGAVAAGALALAIGAAAAPAHVFVSTPLGPVLGTGVGEQFWDLGPFNITCTKAKATGRTSESPSSTFFNSIRFKKCTTAAHLEGKGTNFTLKTKFTTPVVIEYHANGFVEIGSEGEETEGQIELKGGSIEIKVQTIKCLVEIETQVLPLKAVKKPGGEYFAAVFHTESSFKEKHGKPFLSQKLKIENAFKKIHYEFSEGQCEKFKKVEEEQKNGTFTGAFLDEVKGGNLEFQ